MSFVEEPNFHQFSLQKLNSDELIDLSAFKGKKVLVVNVASECGYTPQYDDLQEFYKSYSDKIMVVGVPCNQFGGQEPGTEAEIANFCKSNYGVNFPMTTKVDVKGSGQHPMYKWLTSKALNGQGDYQVSWNFNKFLIDEEGNLIGHFPSNVNPFDEAILSKL
jgi:glutathione peroxidase